MRQAALAPIADVVRLYREGKSQYEIAAILGTCQGTICCRLRTAGITARSRWEHYAKMPPEEAVTLYQSGLPAFQVAKLAGVTPRAVLCRVRAAGIKIRPAKAEPRSGSANHSWKGGRVDRGDGYVWISVGKKRYCAEHRLVMKRILGRDLKKGEIVHHLNGIRDDNRPENLVVTTLKDHEHYTYVKALQRRIRELEAVIPKKNER